MKCLKPIATIFMDQPWSKGQTQEKWKWKVRGKTRREALGLCWNNLFFALFFFSFFLWLPISPFFYFTYKSPLKASKTEALSLLNPYQISIILSFLLHTKQAKKPTTSNTKRLLLSLLFQKRNQTSFYALCSLLLFGSKNGPP